MVTSSAVVGSSAISSFGSQASAMAIITRWRIPPDTRGVLLQAAPAVDADQPSSLRRGPRLPAWSFGVQQDDLDDLVADGVHRVQTHHGS